MHQYFGFLVVLWVLLPAESQIQPFVGLIALLANSEVVIELILGFDHNLMAIFLPLTLELFDLQLSLLLSQSLLFLDELTPLGLLLPLLSAISNIADFCT